MTHPSNRRWFVEWRLISELELALGQWRIARRRVKVGFTVTALFATAAYSCAPYFALLAFIAAAGTWVSINEERDRWTNAYDAALDLGIPLEQFEDFNRLEGLGE